MRYAIITGTPHGQTAPIVISDATTPVHEQKAAFKALARSATSEEFREVQLWTSDAGIMARRRFKHPSDQVPETIEGETSAPSGEEEKPVDEPPVPTPKAPKAARLR